MSSSVIIREFRYKRDLPRVLKICRTCFRNPWGGDEFRHAHRRFDHHIKVVEYDGDLIGFEVYSVSPKVVELLNMAVWPLWQRHGVGSILVEDHQDRIRSSGGDRSIKAVVSEDNMDGLQFLRKNGFTAHIPLLRDYYEGCDGIPMRWSVRHVATAASE